MVHTHFSFTENQLDPLSCAIFIIFSFILSGMAQTMWFRSRLSHPFKMPIDFGLTIRGRRLLGDNKTLRGFMIMLPATAVSFFLLGTIASKVPSVSSRLWAITPSAFALAGLIAGLGFMLGELPNSFLKRQLDIPPGGAPNQTLVRIIFFGVDRFDSIIGMLLAVSLIVPIPLLTWMYVALIGPLIHWFFSVILYWCGVKGRPA